MKLSNVPITLPNHPVTSLKKKSQNICALQQQTIYILHGYQFPKGWHWTLLFFLNHPVFLTLTEQTLKKCSEWQPIGVRKSMNFPYLRSSLFSATHGALHGQGALTPAHPPISAPLGVAQKQTANKGIIHSFSPVVFFRYPGLPSPVLRGRKSRTPHQSPTRQG